MSYILNKNSPNYRPYLFLFLFLAILIFICLNACVSEKERAKICATCQHTDSVKIFKRDTVIIRDTILFLSEVGDTITIPCPEKTSKPIDIIKVKNGIRTELKSNGKTVECDCSALISDTVKKIRIDHYAEIDSMRNETHLLQCDKKHITSYYNFCWWFTLVVLLIISGIIISFGIKFYLSRKI